MSFFQQTRAELKTSHNTLRPFIQAHPEFFVFDNDKAIELKISMHSLKIKFANFKKKRIKNSYYKMSRTRIKMYKTGELTKENKRAIMV